jgi:hypothetical protein
MADRNSNITAISTIDDDFNLNMPLSTSIDFALTAGPNKLTKTITPKVVRNDQPRQMKKGIS